MATPVVTLSVPPNTVLAVGRTVDISVEISGVTGIQGLTIGDFNFPGGTINSVGGSGLNRSVNITLGMTPGTYVFEMSADSIQDIGSADTGPSQHVRLSLVIVSVEYMTFFSDALEGYSVITSGTPEDNEVLIRSLPSNEDVLLCLDKKVRTGLTIVSGSPLVRLSWNSAIELDAVVLVLKDADEWSIQLSGVSPAIPAKTQPSGYVGSSRQFVYVNFGLTSATGLVVRLPDGGMLQEIYVLKKVFAVNYVRSGQRLERPMRYTNYVTDPGERVYRTEDQSLISYSGLSPYGKSEFRLGWDYLPKVWVDAFRDLFYGPPLRKPFFFYPEPLERPNEVFRVYFESCLDRNREVNGFAPYPSAQSLASGYTLDMNFVEI